jgi:hypothetical protein
MISREKYIGPRLGGEPSNEAEHFIKCPKCDAWVDMRDLAQVMDPQSGR